MLASGTRLGPYEILSPLGAGGMGEVYRARDARLEREVAVKVLPEALAADAAALARFEAEARALSTLSHPHILAIHDFGREDGTAYAVTELLEGATLRDRLAEGPLPVRKAVELARDVAQGLAAAHEKGIVHRDLKPENLFVTKGGRIKILDFGLARRTSVPDAGTDTRSPTLVRTEPGTVLGTVIYMSPEQVKGQPADARSDIFSFGAVLFEMLTGRRAFQRATAAESMTAILREDPPELASSGTHVPPALDRIVRHCLEKEPDERFRSAHDLAFALEAVGGSAASEAAAAVPAQRPRGRWWPVPVAVLASAALGLAAGRFTARAPAPSIVSVKPLTNSGAELEPAVSPDGKTIAFSSTRDGVSRIWLKQLASGEEVALSTGPDSAPRFSPDGTQLLFARGPRVRGIVGAYADTTTDLYRMPLLGGAARRVVPLATEGDWSPDGKTIAFVRLKTQGAGVDSGLYLVSPEGGEPKELAKGDGRFLTAPRFSPDGRTIAALSAPAFGNNAVRYELFPVDGGPRRVIDVPPTLGAASGPSWSASGSSLVYVQALLVRFGASRLVRHDLGSGTHTPLLWLPFESTVLDALPDGRLVVESRAARESLVEYSLADPSASPRWLTRGTAVDRQPVFSPDGERLAFSSNRSGNLDIWELAVKTGALRRITEHEADDWDPGYTRDGHPIWSSGRSGHLEIWTAEPDGGSPRQVSRDEVDAENPTATADGWVIYATVNTKGPGMWRVRLDGTSAARIGPCLNIPEVSPDGRHVACPDINVGPIRLVRVADGTVLPAAVDVAPRRPTEVQMGRCRWSPDGARIYFIGQDEKGVNGVFEQAFDPSGKDTRATRRKVAGFDPSFEAESFAISPDGTRLVVAALERTYGVVLVEGLGRNGR